MNIYGLILKETAKAVHIFFCCGNSNEITFSFWIPKKAISFIEEYRFTKTGKQIYKFYIYSWWNNHIQQNIDIAWDKYDETTSASQKHISSSSNVDIDEKYRTYRQGGKRNE